MGKKEKISISKKSGKILPPKKEPTDICNSRIGSTGGYCKNKAGMGTDHVGEGRCKLHGGLSTGRPKKTFAVSEFINTDIVRRFEELSDLDPSALTNMDNEITVVRSEFYRYLQSSQQTGKKKAEVDPAEMKKYLDTLAKMVELKAKLEGKINQQKVPTQMIVYYVNKVTGILDRYISRPCSQCGHLDEGLRKNIATEMKTIEIEPVSDGKRI